MIRFKRVETKRDSLGSLTDCESLIRKMLVVDPARRSSLNQVKRHGWMLAEAPSVPSTGVEAEDRHSSVNEQILRLMQSLGVDPVKTKESVIHQRYDHHAAIYHLLLERRIHLSMASASTESSQQSPVSGKMKKPMGEPSTAPTAAPTATCEAAPGPATSTRRPPLWTHSPPFRDSACGDSVDSERGSVGGSFLSPLMETAPPLVPRRVVKSNTMSIDEGMEDWPDSSSQPDHLGSAGSAFEALSDPSGDQQPVQAPPEQRLHGLELPPALFHEGRRASDGLMCHQPAAASQTPGAAQEASAGVPLLAETHREHRALCLQFDQSKQQQAKQPIQQRTKPVLRQVSYKLAQQQPVMLGTPVSAQCHPIAEAESSSEVSPDHDPDDPRMTAMMLRTTSELDEWCRLPSSLAACDLNLPPP